MNTKFSPHFNANHNRLSRLKNSALNIFDNARRFYWLSSFINTTLNDLRNSDDYRRLPIREQSYIEGMIDAYRNIIRQETAHGYLCNDGKFRINLAGCEKYKYPSERSTKTIITGTCVLVWKAKPEMVHFMDEDTEKILKACRVKFVRDNESIRELPPIPRTKS